LGLTLAAPPAGETSLRLACLWRCACSCSLALLPRYRPVSRYFPGVLVLFSWWEDAWADAELGSPRVETMATGIKSRSPGIQVAFPRGRWLRKLMVDIPSWGLWRRERSSRSFSRTANGEGGNEKTAPSPTYSNPLRSRIRELAVRVMLSGRSALRSACLECRTPSLRAPLGLAGRHMS